MATLAGLKCPYCLVHGVTSHLGSNGVCARCWRKDENAVSSAHTPGPWAIGPTDRVGQRGLLNVVDANGARVADCEAERLGCGLTFVRSQHEDAANARLIAAAPDLLAACKSIAAMAVSWQPLSNGDIADVRAAIAKAEGR